MMMEEVEVGGGGGSRKERVHFLKSSCLDVYEVMYELFQCSSLVS